MNEPTLFEEEAEVKKVSKPAFKRVVSQYSENKRITAEEETNEIIAVIEFDTKHVASVSAKYGVTLNMGNFDSVRFDAMITIPCYTEEVDSAMTFAAEKAEGYVRAQASEYLDKRTKEESDG